MFKQGMGGVNMRVVLRNVIDVTQPINLRKLSPLSKVIVAIKKEWQSSSFVQTSQRNREDASHRERVKKEETIKQMILTQLYQELSKSRSLSSRNLETSSVVIAVKPEYKDILFDELDKAGNTIHVGILNHSDFSQYDMIRIQENSDMRKAFPDMPILFKCSRKQI